MMSSSDGSRRADRFIEGSCAVYAIAVHPYAAPQSADIQSRFALHRLAQIFAASPSEFRFLPDEDIHYHARAFAGERP
jgi:hypothetical protein